MNNGMIVLAGLTLLAAPAAPAAPPAPDSVTSPVAHNAPATIVAQYLTARDTGHTQEAYDLLSPETKRELTYAFYRRTDYKPPNPNARVLYRKPLDRLPIFLSAFFFDTYNKEGYEFHVIGPVPGDQDLVLVSVESSFGLVKEAMTFPVATVPDPTTHIPQIDLEKTSEAPLLGTSEQERRRISLLNLQMIALAVIQYQQEHDEHFPHADHWVDEIAPYVADPLVFHDPALLSLLLGQPVSYAFNRNLSGRSLNEINNPSTIVMLFESSRGVKNTSDTGQSVPRPGRHDGGTDYAFTDGRVKWLPDGTKPSFLLSGK